jgi:tetratricopeptide (TPR) repeat protein
MMPSSTTMKLLQKKYNGFVYALYQKAIIEGLRGRVESKLIALERLTDQYPESEYADEALLQMGITYQEINQLDKAQPPLKKTDRQLQRQNRILQSGFTPARTHQFQPGQYPGRHQLLQAGLLQQSGCPGSKGCYDRTGRNIC